MHVRQPVLWRSFGNHPMRKSKRQRPPTAQWHRRDTYQHALHHIMPGKTTEEAAEQVCRRCNENISVLVVRLEPLCQYVHPLGSIQNCMLKFRADSALPAMSTPRLSND